jgi:hypothetical protein
LRQDEEANPEARAAGKVLIAEGKAAGLNHKTFICISNQPEVNAIETISAMIREAEYKASLYYRPMMHLRLNSFCTSARMNLTHLDPNLM